MTSYLRHVFRHPKKPLTSIQNIRYNVLLGAEKRLLPCLMTSATTLIALVPILTSKGRGSDVLLPMCLPILGGMSSVLITLFLIPVLYAAHQERSLLKPKKTSLNEILSSWNQTCYRLIQKGINTVIKP